MFIPDPEGVFVGIIFETDGNGSPAFAVGSNVMKAIVENINLFTGVITGQIEHPGDKSLKPPSFFVYPDSCGNHPGIPVKIAVGMVERDVSAIFLFRFLKDCGRVSVNRKKNYEGEDIFHNKRLFVIQWLLTNSSTSFLPFDDTAFRMYEKEQVNIKKGSVKLSPVVFLFSKNHR
jgi:hypothetical protein